MLISLLTVSFMIPAAASNNDFKLFTAEELYEIMPAQATGTLSENGEYIRFTSGDIAFAINDIDQFDVSVYKYMVVGARASESNDKKVPANAYMWYNNDPAFGARYGFSSSFRVCWGWSSTNTISEGDSFQKLNFTVTNANREDGSPDGIDYTQGIATLILKPYHSTGMLAEGETFDISYIGFFKTEEETSKFNIDKYDPASSAERTPFVRDSNRPVIILKFDDLGSNYPNFDRVAKILKKKGITGSFGVVGKNITNAKPNSPLVTYMKKWIADGIEIWSHGFYHTKEEFSTDPYDTQLTNFKKTLDDFESLTGAKITSFGSPHNNSGRDTLIMVKDNFPEINTFFHGYKDDNVSSVYHIRNHCALEPGGTGASTDLNNFKIMYSHQKYNSHIFIQTHPGGYNNSKLADLEAMIDYLIADGCTFMTPTQAAADHYVRKPIEVRLENEYVKFDVQPALINGRTMVPFRKILEALEAEVTFDELTSTATAKKDGFTISITKDSTSAYVNGKEFTLDSPAVIVGGRFLVPVRFISESLGSFVHWEHSTKTVTIIPELGKQKLGKDGIEIAKATYSDYQKGPIMLGEYSFDGDTETAWYCEGKTDREIVYELKDTATVKTAEILWYAQGAPFEIYTSTDNISFTLAAEGVAPETFGKTQTVDINKEAKYIKVVTKYNNVNYDHGISEISFTK